MNTRTLRKAALYVALGAGGADARATHLHHAVQMGGMAMDAFAFDQAA